MTFMLEGRLAGMGIDGHPAYGIDRAIASPSHGLAMLVSVGEVTVLCGHGPISA
jgi:hypothetical protein